MKILSQIILMLVLFFGCIFLLQKVDWMSLLNINQVSQSSEEKIGDAIWEYIKSEGKEIENKGLSEPIDSLINRICEANDIDATKLKIHILHNSEVNAFALPNSHLVIYTGLILAAENEGEICGVLGHEIAHIEMKHVMKKLVKEMGLSILLSLASGSGNGDKLKEAIKYLSSSAYDRSLEREADLKSVKYMRKAKLDIEQYAAFLYRLGSNEPEAMKYLSWVSTHPDSKERANYILAQKGIGQMKTRAILGPNSLNEMKALIESINQ
jgi:predicted Zn-dependent protease